MFRSLFGTTIAGEDGGTGGDGSDAAKSSAARQPRPRQGQQQAPPAAAAAASATTKPKKGEKKVADRGGFFQLDPGHAAPGKLHQPTHAEREERKLPVFRASVIVRDVLRRRPSRFSEANVSNGMNVACFLCREVYVRVRSGRREHELQGV